MTRVWGIARLTFAEGVRMRIVVVSLAALFMLIVGMSFRLEGDGTLTGRLQNFLAYSLGALGGLLSLATIFLSCATLSNELKERSLHLVVTKPVRRFEVLAGKWLGVNLLNLVVVVIAGIAIYGFALLVRSRPAEFARDQLQARDIVWTARVASLPEMPLDDMKRAVNARIEEMLKTNELRPEMRNLKFQEEMTSAISSFRTIPPGYASEYHFKNLRAPASADGVIQVRYKVRGTPLPPDEIVYVDWLFCDPNSGAPLHPPVRTEEKSGYVHQFLVRAENVIENGEALLVAMNPAAPETEVNVFFDGDDSLQILYRQGTFEANYMKALGMILLRLALLSAVGLFFSIFVSFPVACLCTSAFFVICILSPFILESIGADSQAWTPNTDPYGRYGPVVRGVLVPILRVVFPDFTKHSGTNYLVDGLYIDAWTLVKTTAWTLVYGAVLILLPGWFIFSRREVAQVQV